MAEIIVAICCNVVAALILVSGIFTAMRQGWKVSLIRLFLTAGAAVGSYFLMPVLSDKLMGVDKVAAFAREGLGLTTTGAINACIFMLLFVAFYLVVNMICSITLHALIKKLENKKQNKAKYKRARSINPHAERVARRSAWKALKAEYKSKNRWWKRAISGIIGAVVALVMGFVVLMPFGYIAAEIENKAFLAAGYEHTINGLIPDSVSEWIVRPASLIEEPEKEEEVGDVEGGEAGEETGGESADGETGGEAVEGNE